MMKEPVFLLLLCLPFSFVSLSFFSRWISILVSLSLDLYLSFFSRWISILRFSLVGFLFLIYLSFFTSIHRFSFTGSFPFASLSFSTSIPPFSLVLLLYQSFLYRLLTVSFIYLSFSASISRFSFVLRLYPSFSSLVLPLFPALTIISISSSDCILHLPFFLRLYLPFLFRSPPLSFVFLSRSTSISRFRLRTRLSKSPKFTLKAFLRSKLCQRIKR